MEGQLLVAQRLRRLRSVIVAPATRRKLEATLRQQFAARYPRPRRWQWGSRLRWSLAILALVLLGGTGVTLSAQASLPGQPLYLLKRTFEATQAGFTAFNELPALYMAFSQQRLTELETLLDRRSLTPEIIAAHAADIDMYTEKSLQLVEQLPPERRAETLRNVIEEIDEQHSIITRLRAAAPAEMHVPLDEASVTIHAHHAEADHQLSSLAPTTPAIATLPPLPTATNDVVNTPWLPSATAPVAASSTATASFTSTTEATPLPTSTAVNETTDTPRPTETNTAPPEPTATRLAASPTAPGQSNCQAHNPHAPRYCTPTPSP
ncbi:MAG: hypothetical protein ACT4QE_22930 [Anaerolineales bacterium]